MKRHLLFVLAVLLAGPMHAQEPPAEAPKQPEAPAVQEQKFSTVSEAEAKADDDDVICSFQEVTGSRFKKRVCATKADWQRARDAAQRQAMGSKRGAPMQPGR